MNKANRASKTQKFVQKTILLTGATGFLGSHLLSALLEEGHRIVVLKKSTSNISRINHLVHKLATYDIDKVALTEVFAMESIEVIIHVATSYSRVHEDELEIVNTNIALGVNLLKNALQHGVEVFVNTDTFFNNANTLTGDTLAYTLSKKHFVEWLKYFSAKGLSVINMKLHHVYGPGDNSQKFVPWLQSRLMSGTGPVKLTKGEQLRDFVL